MARTTQQSAGAISSAQAPENSFHAEDRKHWRNWLQKHHARPDGVWLVFWKKASGRALLSYEEVVEEALCFGWIDSKPNTLDEHRSLLWIAPRKLRTGWSRLNKNRVEKLIAGGQMTPIGLAKVEAAKADGSWAALDAVENLEVPDDLREALAQSPAASRYFDAFPRSAKRSILEWISNAKTPETRAKRVAETAKMAAVNERANQWQK